MKCEKLSLAARRFGPLLPNPVIAALAAVMAVSLNCGLASAGSKLTFNRDIRPILAENCFACHGPDSASRKAGMRLDRRDAAVKMGVIKPGNPAESEALQRILSTEPDEQMPPPALKKKLSPEQIATLRQWIQDGAEYQPLWSFIPPVRPALPAVKNGKWIRNPIDRFTLSKLEERGMQPAPEADRRAIARRLSLDLTGLPPSPEMVEGFVADKSLDAYDKLVDTLMKTPQWGEHRARYWLDAARYGDTHGIHMDNYREIWPYRDWVIAAFNRNEPFDKFTIEQLAGDLLPAASPEAALDQEVASGFNRCNITTGEGGAIDEEYRVIYTRDRTETTARVWLGLTANCAVCHDHKFDPISQKEFYSMSAFFNNTTQPAMDSNLKDTPPVIFVPQPADREQWLKLEGDIAAADKKVEGYKQVAHADFDKWLAAQTGKPAKPALPSDKLEFYAPLDEGNGNEVLMTVESKPRKLAMASKVAWRPGSIADRAFTVPNQGTVEVSDAGDIDGQRPFSYGAWIRLPKNVTDGSAVARMDESDAFRGWDMWIQEGRVGCHLVHSWADNAIKVLTNDRLSLEKWHHVMITSDGSRKASGVKVYVDGKSQQLEIMNDNLRDSMRNKVPLKIAQRHRTSRINGLAMQDLRIYSRALDPAEVARFSTERQMWLAGKGARRTEAEKNELFDHWLAEENTTYRDLIAQKSALEREQNTIRARGAVTHVMHERNEKPNAYVLYRGDYDKRREEVHPETPAFLPPFDKDAPRSRLGLAQWLLRPDQPLTARVTVNRFWQEIFGVGLVKTAEDFGVNGETPLNQELLDWLAVEFQESGWDVKRLFRLMVTSAAYRQSAVVTPEKLEKDPQNRYLSRGPRFRMDAEMVRDYALAASGLLVRKIGGPSVRPYQPDGVWEAVAMQESNTRFYKRDSGENLYRRSMYTFWKRSAPPASMDIFNAPARDICTVRRDRTDTPLQALVTLNDPQFVEAARHLAETALKQGGKPEERIDFIAKRLLLRSLNPQEMKTVLATLDVLAKYYRSNVPEAKRLTMVGESKSDPAIDAGTLAAWTMVDNALMNLDEVLNK